MSEERKTIYLCLAHLSEDRLEQKYVQEAFDTNWVVPMGPNVTAFEEDLRKFVTGNVESAVYQDSRWPEATAAAWNLNPALKDTKVVCLSAGTAAVHLALLACGIGPGDEVCVQSFTFCASSHPITYLGATPVFVDSEPETWNMDPQLLEKAILDRKEKTGKYPKAIVPVALYGMPYKIDEIMAIANKYGIPVVEDAAEGMGSKFNGQVLGTFGKFGVLSFNGNKIITTSGGGALICRNAEDANTIMWYATQARDAYPYYEHTAIGYNYRMSNVCAGIGRGQMTVLDDHIAGLAVLELLAVAFRLALGLGEVDMHDLAVEAEHIAEVLRDCEVVALLGDDALAVERRERVRRHLDKHTLLVDRALVDETELFLSERYLCHGVSFLLQCR